MIRQCFIADCKADGECLEATNIVDHFKECHGSATLNLKSQKAMFKLEYDPHEIDEKACGGGSFVKVPFIINYDGIHFLFVVTRFNGRHYFWLYFVEDGILSGGRQFYAELTLQPTTEMASVRESSPNKIIFPITTPVDEIVKMPSGFLYFLNDKGLRKNYLAGYVYRFSFSLEELKRKVIEISPPSIETEEESNISVVSVDEIQVEEKIIGSEILDLISEEVQASEIEEVGIETNAEIQDKGNETNIEVEEEEIEINAEVEDKDEIQVEEKMSEVPGLISAEVQISEIEEVGIETNAEIQEKGNATNIEVEEEEIEINAEVEKKEIKTVTGIEENKIEQPAAPIEESKESNGNAVTESLPTTDITVVCPVCSYLVCTMSGIKKMTTTPEEDTDPTELPEEKGIPENEKQNSERVPVSSLPKELQMEENPQYMSPFDIFLMEQWKKYHA